MNSSAFLKNFFLSLVYSSGVVVVRRREEGEEEERWRHEEKENIEMEKVMRKG